MMSPIILPRVILPRVTLNMPRRHVSAVATPPGRCPLSIPRVAPLRRLIPRPRGWGWWPYTPTPGDGGVLRRLIPRVRRTRLPRPRRSPLCSRCARPAPPPHPRGHPWGRGIRGRRRETADAVSGVPGRRRRMIPGRLLVPGTGRGFRVLGRRRMIPGRLLVPGPRHRRLFVPGSGHRRLLVPGPGRLLMPPLPSFLLPA